MDLSLLFLAFLQRIAIGAVTVFAIFLIVGFGMPRRSVIAVTRRISRRPF